jgi:hypothetical protein
MKIGIQRIAILPIVACLAAQMGMSAQGQTFAASHRNNPNPELVGQLTRELDITPQQATGGAGAIFGLVQSRLTPTDFGKVAAVVPGMNGFLKAAPARNAASPLGSMAGMAPGGLGAVTSLAGPFQSLHMSPAMIGKFVPVLQKYIGSHGGSGIASIFAGAVK